MIKVRSPVVTNEWNIHISTTTFAVHRKDLTRKALTGNRMVFPLSEYIINGEGSSQKAVG